MYDGERDLLAIPKFFCCVPDRRFVMGQMCRDISDAALTHRKQSVIDDMIDRCVGAELRIGRVIYSTTASRYGTTCLRHE